MNRISYITGLLLFSLYLAAQSTDQNYILTRTYQTENGTSYLDQIQYFNGLGRPVQTVQKAQSSKDGSTWVDLINQTEYDSLGREYRHWLPAPATGDTGGYVNSTDFTGLANAQYGSSEKPYSTTNFETSPLNRVTSKYGVGATWYAAKKNDSISYQTNAGDVAYFYVNSSNQLVRNANYASNTLYKTLTMDEDGKTATEFKDKLGQIVMKRSSTNVDTYFVYNDLGQLAYVLPPNFVDGMGSSTTFTDDNTLLKQFAYLYRYDERRNNVVKRLPGCDSICMVYDKANRLVLSQDGNQRAKTVKQWTVIKYDALGRVVYTGFRNGSENRVQLKAILDPLIITESYAGTGGFNTTGYSCGYFANEITPLTVNYYDDYRFRPLQTYVDTTKLIYSNMDGYDQPYSNAKGLLTGTRIYILDKTVSNYLTTALYYDDRGRVVQTRSSNHLGGYDNVYNHYDFTGKVRTTRKEHNSNVQTLLYEVYANNYDKAGRLTTTDYYYNSPNSFRLTNNSYDELGRLTTKLRHIDTDTLKFVYNIRNWTTMLKSGAFIEELFYNNFTTTKATPCYNGNIAYSTWKYNLLNRAYTYTYDDLNRLKQADAYQLFGSTFFTLGYNETFVYDKMGNILSLQRKSGTTLIDNLGNYNGNQIPYNGNQIMAVTDYAGSQNLYSTKEYNNRNLITNDFAYDKNGNMIKDLDRDIVTIRYNILNLPDTIQFKKGHQIINRYAADGRKLGTEYFTRVPSMILQLDTGQVINQSYIPDFINQNGTAYIDNKEYNTFNGNGTLTLISRVRNTEGYASYNTSPYTGFIYNRTDHLGNIREVWHASSKTTIQRTQYYASGLPWATTAADNLSTQPYKYNGKEFVEMNGYDTYDYGARGYYPAIMRFTSIDGAAELCYKISPYAYCFNNPIRYEDKDGNIPFSKIVKGQLSSPFGFRTLNGITNMHWGQDVSTYHRTGFEVRAAASGEVIAVGYQEDGAGYFIMIDHGNGLASLYMHLLKINNVNVPYHVNNGDILALSGNSGHSTGPHAHIEFRNSSLKNKKNPKGAFSPLSILDLQEYIDNGYSDEYESNKNNPYELDEIIVKAKDLNPPKSLEERIEDLNWSSVKPNKNGNTGRYNKSGRSTDQFYDDNFLKWYYNIK